MIEVLQGYELLSPCAVIWALGCVPYHSMFLWYVVISLNNGPFEDPYYKAGPLFFVTQNGTTI